jgi:7-cyano-7-deazaguanine synthase
VNPQSTLGQYEKPEELPGGVEPTFIPCRNILFLTMAANFALHLESRKPTEKSEVGLVMGVCEADFGGYFDCRTLFIDAMETALNEGLFGGNKEIGELAIYTPLMTLTKKQTVELARDLGCLEEMAYTHTCYQGTETPCRKCHACIIRERGFVEAGEVDPLVLKTHGAWPPEWAMR